MRIVTLFLWWSNWVFSSAWLSNAPSSEPLSLIIPIDNVQHHLLNTLTYHRQICVFSHYLHQSLYTQLPGSIFSSRSMPQKTPSLPIVLRHHGQWLNRNRWCGCPAVLPVMNPSSFALFCCKQFFSEHPTANVLTGCGSYSWEMGAKGRIASPKSHTVLLTAL